jgi:hypothetical protein
MNKHLKNIIAVIAGLILGSIVNMFIILISPHIISPPAGADVTTEEGLKQSLHLLEPKHFLMPFLAHALGTFFGSLITSFIAFNHKLKLGLIAGIIFLIGGIINVIILPAPLWFDIVDLLFAYIPFAYLSGKLILKK